MEKGCPSSRIGFLSELLICATLCLLVISQPAAANAETEVSPIKLLADLKDDAFTQAGSSFELSGSAKVIPGDGLVINESGVNLITNPSFETGHAGWWTDSGAAISRVTSGSVFGYSYGILSTSAPSASLATEIGSTEGSLDPGPYTFSIFARTAEEQPQSFRLQLISDSGNESVGEFFADGDWRRYSVSIDTDSSSTKLAAIITPATAGGNMSLQLDAAQLESKGYLTPYFDGDQDGCHWEGKAGASRSIRYGGKAVLDNGMVDMDPSQPFWFAIDVKLGFNRSDLFGQFPIGTKDFFNLGRPVGDGYGMDGNEGVILDYFSVTKNLDFYKLGGKGIIRYPMPPFESGDRMVVVCSYDDSRGMELWARVGSHSPGYMMVTSDEAKMPADIGDDFTISVSDSGAWSGYGDYHSNSSHRNLVLSQGSVATETAQAYLEDPDGFVAALAGPGATCGIKPDLGISASDAYWADMAEYSAGLLSVDYSLSNGEGSQANNISIAGSICSGGVMAAIIEPRDMGNLPGGLVSTLDFTIKYLVPPGVISFRTAIYATATDACSISYSYPGPWPG